MAGPVRWVVQPVHLPHNLKKQDAMLEHSSRNIMGEMNTKFASERIEPWNLHGHFGLHLTASNLSCRRHKERAAFMLS